MLKPRNKSSFFSWLPSSLLGTTVSLPHIQSLLHQHVRLLFSFSQCPIQHILFLFHECFLMILLSLPLFLLGPWLKSELLQMSPLWDLEVRAQRSHRRERYKWQKWMSLNVLTRKPRRNQENVSAWFWSPFPSPCSQSSSTVTCIRFLSNRFFGKKKILQKGKKMFEKITVVNHLRLPFLHSTANSNVTRPFKANEIPTMQMHLLSIPGQPDPSLQVLQSSLYHVFGVCYNTWLSYLFVN